MELRILNLDPMYFSPEAKTILQKIGPFSEASLSRPQLLEQISNFHILLLRFSHQIDKEIMDKSPQLKIIATNATGTDHIDVDHAQKKGIKVLSLKGEYDLLDQVSSTAELTWGLLLSLTRGIPHAHQSVLHGKWNRNDHIGSDLSGKTLGILGFGRIGKKVVRYALSFSMNVNAYDRHVPNSHIGGVLFSDSLDHFLSQIDILTIHLPLCHETEGLIGKKEINSMKKGSYLINTSRGQIVDENALLEALQSGHLAGAALDVLYGDHDSNFLESHPLVDYARNNTNLILTPHIGGTTFEAWKKTEVFMAQKIFDYVSKNGQSFQ